MKNLLLSLFLLALAVPAMALPAKRGVTRNITQPDGTRLTAALCGDEHLHYLSMPSGEPIVRDAAGTWRYAEVRDGALRPSSIAVTVSPSEAVRKSISRLNNSADAIRLLRAERIGNALPRLARVSPNGRLLPDAGDKYKGTRRGLVILAEYQDVHFSFSKAQLDSVLNVDGYQTYYAEGSVHDYFKRQSGGQFSLTFDVVGPVRLSGNMADYGADNLMGDVGVGNMVAEAVQLAADSVKNFADYDWDGDGKVDQVVVLYAGYGESFGANENTIWPQENTLTKSDFRGPLTIGGVKIDTYAVTCELIGNETSFGGEKYITGAGPMCHEFAHCLGIPDFYDTVDNDHFCLENYDLMDAGAYNNGTYCPAGFSGLEKWLCGWQQPIELTEPTTVSNIQPLSDGGNFYVVYNDQYGGRNNEFYIIENRQWRGFDTFIPGHGVLISHVNYIEAAWRNNSLNQTYGKEGVRIVPANNQYNYADSIQHDMTYPFNGNDSLTNTSTPAARVFNVNKNFRMTLDKPITNIAVDSIGRTGIASFTFMGGTADAISAPSASRDNGITEWYDLAGRRINRQSRGIVIERRNGQSVKHINHTM